MSRFKNIIYILIIAALIFSVTGLTSTNSESTRVQSEVLDIASDAPDQSVRVIIQKTKSATEVEALINKLGGKCLKDLPFINAVVAEIAAQNAIQLSKSPAVRWVSLDAPMVRSSSESYILRDEFNEKSYDNNDGTVTWRSDWVELGDNGSPTSGAIKIHKGYLRLILANRAIQRQADLSGAQYAFLSFEYQKNSLGNGESISIQVSPDGGLFWFELDQIVGGEYDNNWIPTSYDISSYIGYNTTIRFIGGSNLEGFDLIKIDNVQIEFSGGQGQGGTISNDLITVGDDFEIRSFNNNTGTANWIGDWIEIGEDNGANRGFVRIGKVPTTKNLGLGFLKENVGAQRMVDLSGAIYARLDLDYQVANLQSEKFIALEISKDGGATWVELDRLKGSSTLLFSNQVSYNIANFISDQTIIRFVTSEDYSGGVVFINDIQIEYNDGTAPNNTYLDTLNVKPVWDMGFKGEGITVAVVDSGITNDQDFSTDPSLSTSSSRLIAQSNFNNDSSFLGDAYGHGTHVAGVIGGNGFMSNGVYQGIAPGVNLIGLKISDDQGMAYESDTVNALAWILEHKDEHNIRVVNLSINSTVEDSYHNSPLDAALEILWFNGIVVVASAGNQASDGEINIFNAAPANDPFIITVGASHENYTSDRADDSVAPFSAQGLTTDGYHKPDIVAPGKDIISVLANNSEWARNYPDRAVIGRQYFRISGTSVSASMVAGAAALILQAEPDLTPDQVKYRLINTGSTIGTDAEYPYMDIQFAVTTPTTEYANQGVIPHQLLAKMAMIAYWANQNSEDEIDWSSVNWSSVNWSSVNWSSVNWSSVNWSSVNWSSVNWSSVNWSSVNWSSVNWSSVNWGSVDWDN